MRLFKAGGRALLEVFFILPVVTNFPIFMFFAPFSGVSLQCDRNFNPPDTSGDWQTLSRVSDAPL